jgi:glutamate-1-semialdehyde 2,1-aminomutase
MFTLFFAKDKVSDYETAKRSDTVLFGKYFNAMLEQGVYLAPSQFEAMFISNAIGKEEIDKILKASDLAFKSLY